MPVLSTKKVSDVKKNFSIILQKNISDALEVHGFIVKYGPTENHEKAGSWKKRLLFLFFCLV